MVVEQLLEQLAELLLVLRALDLGEVVEDVEGADVELVHGEDGWVAAHDEGQAADAGDAVGDTDGQLLLQVVGASL